MSESHLSEADALTGPRGYFRTSFTVADVTADYVRGLVRHLPDSTQKLFFHIVACSIANPWEASVPVSSRLIDNCAPGAKWEDLAHAGLIGASGYSIRAGLSREFRLCDDVVRTFLNLEPATAADAERSTWVNLFTGKRCKPERTGRYDQQRHLIGGAGSPLADALVVYSSIQAPFNAWAIEDHLARMEREVTLAHAAWKATGGAVYTPEYEQFTATYGELRDDFNGQTLTVPYAAYRRARCRWLNDRRCYTAILQQDANSAPDLGHGFYRYRPAYETTASGRVHQVGGGLQSCSREMKEAAYSGVPGLFNYDLKSSQPRILQQLYSEAPAEWRPDGTWLQRYTDDPSAKVRLAAEAGISVDAWKSVFCAVMMGAYLPKNPSRSNGKVVRVVEEAHPGDVAAAYEHVKNALSPFYNEHKLWLEFLCTAYFDSYGRQCRGGTYIRNESGAQLFEDDLDQKDAHRRKAQIAAFLLQGREAAFIHSLAALADEFGFVVVANEHDGLITLGPIPDEAVRRAADRSGLLDPVLVEKDLVGRGSRPDQSASSMPTAGFEYVITSTGPLGTAYVVSIDALAPVTAPSPAAAPVLRDPELYRVMSGLMEVQFQSVDFWRLAGAESPGDYYARVTSGRAAEHPALL